MKYTEGDRASVLSLLLPIKNHHFVFTSPLCLIFCVSVFKTSLCVLF